MTEIDLLQSPLLKFICQEKALIRERKVSADYNLFTISNYSSYLENFHSDIIASLLNPKGLHDESYKLLHLFIDYINNSFSTSIDLSDYVETEVHREKGRIDVWIKDVGSKKCIIIENKINDAVDRDDQLLDYFNYAVDCGYEVDAIIYLSKNGEKVAPKISALVDRIVINMAAFDDTEYDLYKNWLLPAVEASTNADTKAFILQYSKLIAHLANSKMESMIKEDFYKFISDNNCFDTLGSLAELYTFLPDYRAEVFSKHTKEYHPFKNRFKYRNNYWIFEKFKDNNGSYKLDVFFNSQGGANIVLWNTEKPNSQGYEAVKRILSQLDMVNDFAGESMYHGFNAEFKLDRFANIETLDNAVLALVKKIFLKLPALNAKN